jgi:hypothetical protein
MKTVIPEQAPGSWGGRVVRHRGSLGRARRPWQIRQRNVVWRPACPVRQGHGSRICVCIPRLAAAPAPIHGHRACAGNGREFRLSGRIHRRCRRHQLGAEFFHPRLLRGAASEVTSRARRSKPRHAERWQSGRSRRTRNAKYGQLYRGFESLPLRQLTVSADLRPSQKSSKNQVNTVDWPENPAYSLSRCLLASQTNWGIDCRRTMAGSHVEKKFTAVRVKALKVPGR